MFTRTTALACALGCFAFVGADDAPKSKQKAQENPAKEVFHEYLRNEVAAERKFLKKRLKAAGFIKEISEKDGKIVVLLKTDDYPFGVLYEGFSCVFDDDKGIDALSVRGKATIDGEVAGHTKMKTPLATNSVDAHPEYQQIVTLVHCRIVAEIDARSDILKAEKEQNGQRDLKEKT